MTEPPSPAAPEAPQGPWARLRSHILHPEMTSEQIALSFALGFSISFNPLLGLHTLLVLGLCLVFSRLHRPLMLAAAFINNPWTLVPIATSSLLAGNVLLGHGWCLGRHRVAWHLLGWRSFVTREGFRAMMDALGPFLGPYLLGGFVLSLLALPVGYAFMLFLSRRLRRLHLPHRRPRP